jgi:hypothetical protein
MTDGSRLSGLGYLDSWHGAGTLALLPVFALGLWKSRKLATTRTTPWLRSDDAKTVHPFNRAGRWGLLATGFGGGLASAGVLVAICAWFARPGKAFHEAIVIAGVAGFGCAIGVHYFEGYTDVSHLGQRSRARRCSS